MAFPMTIPETGIRKLGRSSKTRANAIGTRMAPVARPMHPRAKRKVAARRSMRRAAVRAATRTITSSRATDRAAPATARLNTRVTRKEARYCGLVKRSRKLSSQTKVEAMPKGSWRSTDW